MPATTIQISDETRERLKQYKIAGMTYEDVVKLFMEILGPEEFHAVYRKWQAGVVKEIRKSRKWQDFAP
jgi:hypothetical protein